MVANLTYRTDDGTRWGGGKGSNLSATEVDINFWALFSAVTALEDHQDTLASIASIAIVAGNQMFVTLTNSTVLGPLIVPTAQWNFRGAWAATTHYAPFDVVSNNGSLYLVLVDHTSASTFSPSADDGFTHALYGLLLAEPSDMLPAGGTIHQRLVKASGSPYATEWESAFLRLVMFVEGQPAANELVLQYLVVDDCYLPAGLTGSIAFANTPTASNVQFTISKNGAPLGTINFNGPSPETITVSFSAKVSFVPGDVLTINAPTLPDTQQADISIVLVATLT